MSKYIETYRGVVHPWFCDQLGHMNVRHYVSMFDDGCFHLMNAIGAKMSEGGEQGISFADVKHVIEYKAEQRVGSLVVIEGCVRRIGGKSITLFQQMQNIDTGVIAATTEITTVCFDLKARRAILIPDALRERMKPFVVEEAGAA